jgi:uncharacterized membrane protein HdeD (DUF308 family)
MVNIASHWWMFVVRGLLSLAIAALLLLGPSWSSNEAVALAFGIYAIVDGVTSLGFVAGAQDVRRAPYVARAVIGIVAGALALAVPSAPTLALYVLAGSWGIVTGALEIAFGSRAWTAVPKALGLMLAGTVAFGFGLTLLVLPTESVQTLRVFFVVFAIANGIAATALGEKIHHALAPRDLHPVS